MARQRARRSGSIVSINSPHSAIRDAKQGGFIERRADDEGLVILTARGRAAASQ